jgi:RNA-directed DNA polymerase
LAIRSKSLSPNAETFGTVKSASGSLSAEAFERCFSEKSLEYEFEGLCLSHLDIFSGNPKIATGADRISIDLFNRDKAKHIAALSRKVCGNRYTFAPLRERDIPKPGGGSRTISISSIRDAVCQRALYRYLYDAVDSHLLPNVFGYRKNVGVHSAIGAIRRAIENGATHVLDADIQKFFDNVNHEKLMAKVENLNLEPRANTLIYRFLKTPGADAPTAALRATTRKVGVPQGGVISGLITNLFLADFDKTMVGSFPGYVRYADDFVICCGSEREAAEAETTARKALENINLTLHGTPKTQIRRVDRGFDFLGFRITIKDVCIREQNIAKFKNRVIAIVENHKSRHDAKATLSALIERLRPKIEGPSPEILQKLVDTGLLHQGSPRSWVGFFKIITDDTQIRALDKWIRAQISAYMWRQHRCRARLKLMQECGLPSLQASIWDVRNNDRPAPTTPLALLPVSPQPSRPRSPSSTTA